MIGREGLAGRALGLVTFTALVACVHGHAWVQPARSGVDWGLHEVSAGREGTTNTEGLEARARREAEAYCAERGMAVERFSVEFEGGRGEHDIRGLAPGSRVQVPDKAYFQGRFRCMSEDRVLAPPADAPRCPGPPGAELVWASRSPLGVEALFANSSRLTLTSLEREPGPHPLHAIDGAYLTIEDPEFGIHQALSGRYSLDGQRLVLDGLRLFHDGQYSALDTCWSELDHLEVELLEPEWVDADLPLCEGIDLRQPGGLGPELRMKRDDAPGAWIDAASGPTLDSPEYRRDLQLHVELKVPPRTGRYPVGQALAVELVIDGRRLRAYGGILELSVRRDGALSGRFDELWLIAEGDEPCFESLSLYAPSWTAEAP